jgi:hypothetical protein
MGVIRTAERFHQLYDYAIRYSIRTAERFHQL